MTTDNKNEYRDKDYGGLDNTVQQNHGLEEDAQNTESSREPVNNGGVETSNFDLELEEQWLAVRDEYLAHYPYVLDSDTKYEKGSFYIIIENLAKRTQRSPEEIHNEILNWNSDK
ncbi:hypothetical protein H0I23_15170 [Cellulophaga sp. HaHaR_3_176]|uniref:hypothetical protein n=1 Tax=Cellulophaga sp. HaHaR_3_176 TaxID=1942464 RepID=UPI001C1FC37E|nr:hypothetical protein [Cellulophaga sp. HaHaR_3_176]QWX83772.1 hypothetical protein H0I23_15170 [Cellulophaga sp. HaHaR_3_176]